jgi:hypothetical protein
MFATNFDVEDGLVNRALGILKYAERLTEDEAVEEDIENPKPGWRTESKNLVSRLRLWMRFASDRVARRLRMKVKPHVLSKQSELKQTWIPIRQGSVGIGIGRNGGFRSTRTISRRSRLRHHLTYVARRDIRQCRHAIRQEARATNGLRRHELSYKFRQATSPRKR